MPNSTLTWAIWKLLAFLASQPELPRDIAIRLEELPGKIASVERLLDRSIVACSVRRVAVHPNGVLLRFSVTNLGRRPLLASGIELGFSARSVKLVGPDGTVWAPKWSRPVKPGDFAPYIVSWDELRHFRFGQWEEREFTMYEPLWWIEGSVRGVGRRPIPTGRVLAGVAATTNYHLVERDGKARSRPLWSLGWSDTEVVVSDQPIPMDDLSVLGRQIVRPEMPRR